MTEPPTEHAPLTEDEAQTLKVGAFGAVFLVANADPGIFNVLRESFAASGAISASTGLVRAVLTSGRLPRLPESSGDVAGVVLPALSDSVTILAAKAPAEVANFRSTVVNAVERVAAASDGVSEKESAMVASVREALGA